MARWLLYCATLSTLCAACAEQDEPVPRAPRVELVLPEIPSELLSCAGVPAVPGDDATQRDVSRFLARLHASYWDCKTKLGAVAEIIKDLPEPPRDEDQNP